MEKSSQNLCWIAVIAVIQEFFWNIQFPLETSNFSFMSYKFFWKLGQLKWKLSYPQYFLQIKILIIIKTYGSATIQYLLVSDGILHFTQAMQLITFLGQKGMIKTWLHEKYLNLLMTWFRLIFAVFRKNIYYFLVNL